MQTLTCWHVLTTSAKKLATFCKNHAKSCCADTKNLRFKTLIKPILKKIKSNMSFKNAKIAVFVRHSEFRALFDIRRCLHKTPPTSWRLDVRLKLKACLRIDETRSQSNSQLLLKSNICFLQTTLKKL